MAKYSKAAGKSVKSAVKRMKKGTLNSGNSGKKVTSRKQAIAIGLSEAREKGAKVPAPKKAAPKKKAAAKKTAPQNAAAKKKTAPKKKAAPQKTKIKKSSNTRDSSELSPGDLPGPAGEPPSKADTKIPVPENSEAFFSGTPADLQYIPEELKTTPADPYHGNVHPSKAKTPVKPSGKKPLWDNRK